LYEALTDGAAGLRSVTMRSANLRTPLFVVLFLFLFANLTIPAWAQKDAGSIVGTVKDPSGALISNAKVTITDVEHGQTFTTTTDTQGEFVASPLRVGRYTVTVQQTGF
jgi:Carboxypeptidase regulatory-like domain